MSKVRDSVGHGHGLAKSGISPIVIFSAHFGTQSSSIKPLPFLGRFFNQFQVIFLRLPSA